MKELNLQTPLMAMRDDELTAADRTLVMKAREATFRSYSPYSHFCVGAAILLDNGEIVTGSNQENAAFAGCCAERTAAFYAHAQWPDARFVTIAIAARGTSGSEVADPISPCGSCRQALLEYEMLAGKGVRVIMAGSRQCYIAQSVASLLPLAFADFK